MTSSRDSYPLIGAGALSVLVWLVFVRAVEPLDLDAFLAGGRAVAAHRNPYPPLGTPAVWSGSAFVYPWLTAWLFVPATALSAHGAGLLMTALSIGAVAGGVWALVGLRLVPFACVLLASPTIDGIQMGTVNAFLFLGLCLAWRWRDRRAASGIVVGVLVGLKILCWPLVAWFILTRRWRSTAWAGATGTTLLGVGWLMGPLGPTSYSTLLSQLAAHEASTSSGLQGMLVRWLVPASVAEAVGLACAAAVMAMVWRREDALIYAGSVVAAFLATPVLWHHYYLLAAAPLLLTKNGAWWYLLIGWASVSARDTYGISWRLVSAAALVVLTIAVFVVVNRWRKGRPVRPEVGAGVAVGVVVALVGLAAVDLVAGPAALLRGLAQAAIPVGGTIALLIAAILRSRRHCSAPSERETRLRTP